MSLSDLKVEFEPGKTRIKYGGAYTKEDDFEAIQSVLDRNWWTMADEGKLLEQELAEKINMKGAVLTNSGSSALLVAFASLKLSKGSEIITGAVHFPTAISAMYYSGLMPVFVDVDPYDYNPSPSQIEKQITGATSGILLVAIAGQIPDLPRYVALAKKYRLKLILDNCDGFGGTYNGKSIDSFFDVSTTSFHAAHIMCMGEGGAVFSNDEEYLNRARSFSSWGRVGDTDDNTVYEDIPSDYPGRYIFKEIGFNLKPLELQCALGRTQLKKLDDIKNRRSKNFTILQNELISVREVSPARPHNGASPSWFSFPMLVERRSELKKFLESRNIETRTIFGGNITRQPAFKGIGKIMENLDVADEIMEKGMFVSVHPNNTEEMMRYIGQSIREFYGY